MVGISPAGISQRRSGHLVAAFQENVPILSLLRVYVLKHSETVSESYVVSCGGLGMYSTSSHRNHGQLILDVVLF